ncbi:ATP-binding protein [Paratractidigestivibacter sp.]|uniref:ATP-binding protein n=1 Tax=Paratractidigestivibacter sp. TaxID=2847316 RepID=UPI002AC98E00|nr:ATP-binding protein [Paratractidigestivibacter sp.]
MAECLSFVRRNLSQSTKIDPSSGERIDELDLPMVAVREVILNALVHRDYSIHTEAMPVQVELYSDRLEVRNPGGLYGRLTVDQLGKVQPDTRNPALATAMEVLGQTENRYSEIPTIRLAMRQAGKPEPEFTDTGSEFHVTLRIHASENASPDGTKQREAGKQSRTTKRAAALLAFCNEPRSRAEIAEMLGIGEFYASRAYINPLLDKGLLARTEPEKPRSKSQRYVRAR